MRINEFDKILNQLDKMTIPELNELIFMAQSTIDEKEMEKQGDIFKAITKLMQEFTETNGVIHFVFNDHLYTFEQIDMYYTPGFITFERK